MKSKLVLLSTSDNVNVIEGINQREEDQCGGEGVREPAEP
jgi:hypothetical protein